MKQQYRLVLLVLASALLSGCMSQPQPLPPAPAPAPTQPEQVEPPAAVAEPLRAAGSESEPDPVVSLCAEIGAKLGSVSAPDCLRQNLQASAASVQQRALAYKDYPPLAATTPLGRGIADWRYSRRRVLFCVSGLQVDGHTQ